MSSFKRKATGKQTLNVYPGTRISPASNLSLITSTGLSSLDDILGGGLPLSCSLVFGAPDIHSSYGELIQKYFVAQGMGSGHRVCVVGEDPERFVRDVMWFPKSQAALQKAAESEDEDKPADQDQKVKIAWRYEKMKQFQTTVGTQDGDCLPFELSSRVPEDMIDDGLLSKRIHLVDVGMSMVDILGEISRFLEAEAETKEATRICIPALGSPGWGDLTPQSVLYFLHSLRGILQRHGHGCASVSLPGHVSTDGWGGVGWMEKVGWSADGAVTVSAFTANPGLASIFPSHHGLVSVHRLPSPHTLSPPSDRFSTLRGLGSSGENNLGFKCTRKRLIFETVHLDVEGGTGERRTTPSTTATVTPAVGKVARVEVEIESTEARKVKPGRKRVVFENDF